MKIKFCFNKIKTLLFMIRVRQLTDPMKDNVPELVSTGILPTDCFDILNENKLVRYPDFVYKLSKKYNWVFSHFGVFIEYLFKKMLNDPQNWKKDIYDLYIASSYLYTIGDSVSSKDFYKYMGRFTNMFKFVNDHFKGKNIVYESEIIYGVLSGHPDVIVKHDNGSIDIYDIKNVSKFNTPDTRNQAILQIFTYLVLARKSGFVVENIGIILPMQQKVLKINVVNFNDTKLFEFLKIKLYFQRFHQ